MKYVDTMVTFREVPDEITLCINISGCKIHCPDCHSKHLWEDIGNILDTKTLDSLIEANKGITCVSFMGGEPNDIAYFLFWVKTRHPLIKTCYYTGRKWLSHEEISTINRYLDYLKIGPYIKEKGGLDNPNTNQSFYKKVESSEEYYWEDITYKFQNKTEQNYEIKD